MVFFKGFLAIAILLYVMPAQYVFGAVFKCEIGGKLIFQDEPCQEGAQQTVVVAQENSQPEVEYDQHKYDESKFSDWENTLIKAGKVEVGMSVEALEQSWGSPKDINRSAYGPEQWVFRDGMYGQRYAYVRDGKVVNWQD
ncbi:hypothetical protein [Shewanella sp. SM95]|uniref:hypothetical protein n=1 Tax=Shewanella sp. SM95 TaxID=2912812 RepID=UPI0021D9827F|nr:hypothetical protein [Shewanella sp. SM95]MCU8000190.1 hypothetical protein [Shewanella sp. SM95]